MLVSVKVAVVICHVSPPDLRATMTFNSDDGRIVERTFLTLGGEPLEEFSLDTESVHQDGLTQSTADLSRPIAIGRTAELFAWRDGEVLKLLREDFPASLGEAESRAAKLVAGLGVPAPQLLGTVTVNGRFGLVYERVDGPSMLDLLASEPARLDALATRFADLHVSLHATSGHGLPAQKDVLRTAIGRADFLGDDIVDAALERLDSLPDGDRLCHGDMHPGNILMVAADPIVIDWLTATRGDPAGDVARTLFLLREARVPDGVGVQAGAVISDSRRRFADRYLAAYRRRHSVSDNVLGAWSLPILASRLSEGIDAERVELEQRLRDEMLA
jgi:uncharacterized protein (TIGR02172 family)